VLATVGILIGAQHPAARQGDLQHGLAAARQFHWHHGGGRKGLFQRSQSRRQHHRRATAETARRRSWITGCSFGHVDSISMLLNCKNGGKIRFIGATNTRSPAAIYYIKGGHQQEILDFLR